MSTYVGVGKSKLLDSKEAGSEAVLNALKTLNDKKPSMVFVYTTFGYDFAELCKTIKEKAGDAPLVGCTVFGIIDKEELGDTDLHRVLVCAIYSDDFVMTPFVVNGLFNKSVEIGQKINQIIRGSNINDVKGLYLLMDGLKNTDPDSMLREMEKDLQSKFSIFGGSAAEPLLWKNTYQFYNTDIMEDSVVGVIFSGKVEISVASSHGSQDLGGYHTVTKAEGSRIYEIDNKPAMDLFSELYGEEQAQINGLTAAGVCLGTKIPISETEDKIELRIPLKSEEDRSIIMAAAWPVGTKIYVCQRDIDLVTKKNVEELSIIVKEHSGKVPLFVFEADCLGRSPDKIGIDASTKEVRESINTLNGKPYWFGGYMLGELASVGNLGAFHNWTGSFACFYVEE